MCVMSHLAVSGGEDGSEDLAVLLHLLELAFQGALHVCVGQHVLHHVLLQGTPQSPLVAVVKLEPGEEEDYRVEGEVNQNNG